MSTFWGGRLGGGWQLTNPTPHPVAEERTCELPHPLELIDVTGICKSGQSLLDRRGVVTPCGIEKVIGAHMGPANNGKRAKNPPLMKRQKPDIHFVRTPLMGKDVPIGGIKLCTVYAFPVLRVSL